MINAEEVQCCRDRDTPYQPQRLPRRLPPDVLVSNVGGGFTGRLTGWVGCSTNVLILSCDVVSNVRSNGQVFHFVSLECQDYSSVRAGLPRASFGPTLL